MESLISQLKQRQVFKVATIYAVSAWPLIQVADLAVPAIGLPDSVMTLLLKIFFIGFPITLVFAWLFNFTATGIVRAGEKQELNSDSSQVNVHTTLVVVGTLVVALLVTLGSQFLMQSPVTQKTPQLAQAVPLSVSTNTLDTSPINRKESIAILPFIPFSEDPADEFFADGMVEELLNLLAKIPDLQVSARTSSFAYKNVSNKTIIQIGEELGVDTILEGSIRKNDVTNQIRVTAQLIKVSTGEHLWSETFDREYRDIFQIQDDIARAVVDKMRVTLLGDTLTTSFVAETKNVDAMVAFGKGQQEIAHRTVPSLTKALTYFEQAVLADNQYARAYVGIANSNILLALYGNLPKTIAYENAEEALTKALSLNDKLGATYASLGLLWSDKDSEIAEKHFETAISLNPNYAMTYMWYGSLLKERGLFDQSHQLFERAFELNPKSPVAAFNVAAGYYQLGNEEKAMELFSHIIGNDPYYPSAYNLVGDILSNRGRLDEAIAMYNRALDVDDINKNAIRGLLISSMDMRDYKRTEQWFDYIARHPLLFSSSEVDLFKARFYAVQKNLSLALESLENVQVHDEMTNINIKAETAFYRKEYGQAAKLYKSNQSDNEMDKSFYAKSDGLAAIHLAFSYQQLEQYNDAEQVINDFLDYLKVEKDRKTNHPSYFYQMASISALRNNKEEVYYYLQAAIDAGWIRTWQADNEPVFAFLSKEQQYTQMIGGVNAKLENMKSRLNNEESFLLADSESFESFH
jgi:TolB-like protein/Tfp pilus assembly protein PilF